MLLEAEDEEELLSPADAKPVARAAAPTDAEAPKLALESSLRLPEEELTSPKDDDAEPEAMAAARPDADDP